jgi:hypothetical protein
MHDDRLIVNGDVTPGNLGHGAYAHFLLMSEDLFEKAIVCARARSGRG